MSLMWYANKPEQRSMRENFDPVHSDTDFEELTRLTLEAFRKNYKELVGTLPEETVFGADYLSAPGAPVISVRKTGARHEKREITVSAPLPPHIAMQVESLRGTGSQLAFREFFSRLLERYGDFSILADIRSGKNLPVTAIWDACHREAESLPGAGKTWSKVIAEITSVPLSTKYALWIKTTVDPAKPVEKQLSTFFSFSVSSPYMAESESEKPLSFPEWLRATMDNWHGKTA